MKEKYNNRLSARTKRFLDQSRLRVGKDITSPKTKNWSRAFFEIYQDEPLRERQALSLAYALKNEPVILFKDELLVGQIYQTVPGSWSCDLGGSAIGDEDYDDLWSEFDAAKVAEDRILMELPALKPIAGCAESWISPIRCAPGHIGWRWNWIVENGIVGVIDRIHDVYDQQDAEGKEFLDGMRICLGAMIEWAQKHIAELEKRVGKANGKEKKQLLEKLEICRQVPLRGARNFHEAVQAFHISYLAVIFENPHGGNGPGRLDYFLWPYLENDLRTGRETLKTARKLIDELFIRFHERLMYRSDGWVETIVVGGCHPNGSCAVNPLSKIMVESIGALKISHPSVYIRMPENPPEDFIETAAYDLRYGGNRAQVVSDSAIVKAMTKNSNVVVEDARMYMCGGCMEISPHGMNGDLLFTGFFNVPKVLEYVLTGGVCLNTGKKMFTHLKKSLPKFKNFEELYSSFEKELNRILQLVFQRMDITSEEFARLRPRFLVSSLVEDCIKNGRGINNGGARYEDYGSTPLGIPNVGDSLQAIKTAVFDESFVSRTKLLKALKNNFKNNESLRQHLLRIPKFGQGNKEADAMVNRVLNSVCDSYGAFTNRMGGRVKPMIMTFSMAPVTGAALGATPDGRKAKQPIAHGLTPQNNSMTEGITTAMLSANTLDLDRFSGGTSSMWDLDHKFATQDNLKSLLKTFIQSGGQMYQGNSTDVKELIKARKNPEQYQNLMVRIGGFSGKFVSLSDALQVEIINRYRHNQ